MEEVFIIKKSMVFIVGLLGILLVIYVAYGMQNKKYVDVYSVVKDAFLTDKGYTTRVWRHNFPSIGLARVAASLE